jgi:glycerophosphoryl diester phosphodiesterase
LRRLAHRGDSRAAPENSLAALLAATNLPGIDGVELDVQLSADAVPVVTHDADLRRIHGIDAPVRGLDSAALGGYGIPRLAEVFEALPVEAFIDIDLKVEPSRALVEVCIAGRGAKPERAAFDSMDPAVLSTLRELAPGWPRWLGTESLDGAVVAAASTAGCQAISAEWQAIDPVSARLVIDAGLELAAWTITEPGLVSQMARLGVTTVFVEGDALRGAASSTADANAG